MDAVHLARGATGRDMILKIEGSYHGHHDAVMVSVYPDLEALGERDDPRSVVYGEGYPKAITELTRAVPFNDADALESVLGKLEGQVAGLIMEPAMMNINIIPPVEGYLRAGPRAAPRARRQADLRRGEDRARRSATAAPPSASASSPTWSRWPRRSAAATPAARSG